MTFRTIVHRRLILCAAGILAGCSATGTPTKADSAEMRTAKEAVERRAGEFVALLRSNQFVDSVRAYHSADFRSYENQMEVPNRTALEGMFSEVAKTMKVDSFALLSREVFVHDNGTVAYQLGDYREALSYRDGKTPPLYAHNNFVIRWVKEPDGVWRMSRFVATPAPGQTAGKQ